MTTITQDTSAATGFVKSFGEIGMDDIPTVGGKNASLGEMFRELGAAGVKVPDGFAITADAYRHFLVKAGLDREIERVMAGLDTANLEELSRRGSQIRHAVLAADLPASLEEAITHAYAQLCGGAPHPIEQLRAKLAFQRLDLFAERRLRNMQLARSPRHVPQPRNCLEIA